MALKKLQNFKEIDLNYHSIISYTYSKIEDRTFVTVGIYKDKQSADDDVANYISQYQTSFDGGDYSIADLYDKLKESKTIEQVATPAVPAITDEYGKITTPAVDATYKQVETNFYVDAVDA